jgi:PAS domain S-box-containing protein
MTQERILIVEDEKVTALEIAEHLRQLGYSPLGPCAYGKEAVTSALALHPDVILMDISLKGPMDGIQAAEAIRSGCPCPVIYVTAHADQATLDRAKITEPFGYVLKPISQRELHIAIQIGLYRHGLEGKLKESEERYRTAIESSNDGVVITREGRAVYVNQRFLDLFGYDGPEEVLGASVAGARHVHPEDRERITEIIRRTQAGETTTSRYDARAVHKDGRVLHMEASATRIVYQGAPAFLGYLRDITARKQAELRVRESEEAMKSLLNATNDIALLIDTGGTIIAANAVLAQRLSTEVNKLISRNIFDLFPEDIAHGRRLWVEKVVETGKPARFEDKSLYERYFDSCVYPVLDAEGKVVRLAVYAKDITEARGASRALAESEARFKQLFDSMNDGISLRDARTFELVDTNRRFCEMYGYTLEELKALPRGALAVDESTDERRKRLEAQYGQAAKGAPHHFQLEGRRKDGSTFWVEMNVERLALGGMDCLLTVSRDITERRKAEEALENSETRLQQLFDNINDGITVLDGHTFEILDLNQRVCQIYGYTQEEFRSMPLGSFSSEGPDYGRRTLTAHYERAMTGEPELFERQVRRKDGRLVWVEMNLKKVSLGGRDCVLSVIRDVSERKQGEELIKKLFLNLPVAAHLSIGGALRLASERLWKLTGYSENELMETDLSRIVHPDDRQSVRQQAIAMLKGETISPYEFRILNKEGQIRWVMGSAISVQYNGNRATLGSYMDITERKLLESQLVQAQKLESIGQLAAGIAHEINTPTQYVGDNIHFLKDAFTGMIALTGKYKELLDTVKAGKVTKGIVDEIEETMEKTDIAYLREEMPKAIQQSMEGVERVTGIVRAMKEFSHPGTKEKEPIDINRAIENTLTVSRNAWKYVADVVTEFDPSLPLVPCLPGEFNQVVLNIIVNAAQAIAEKNGTSAEKGNIRVSTFNRDRWAEISISDNGPGIPEEIRSHIFDPFFTTKEVGKGTGQGLAIARSIIVDKHQGEITLDTVPGEGTTFTIWVPVGEGA